MNYVIVKDNDFDFHQNNYNLAMEMGDQPIYKDGVGLHKILINLLICFFKKNYCIHINRVY